MLDAQWGDGDRLLTSGSISNRRAMTGFRGIFDQGGVCNTQLTACEVSKRQCRGKSSSAQSRLNVYCRNGNILLGRMRTCMDTLSRFGLSVK